jgi:hypothetical protein
MLLDCNLEAFTAQDVKSILLSKTNYVNHPDLDSI